MLDNNLIEKLQKWVDANPESADTPFVNISTGEEFTIRGLLSLVRSSVAGEALLSDSVQSEINKLESWIGGLKNV